MDELKIEENKKQEPSRVFSSELRSIINMLHCSVDDFNSNKIMTDEFNKKCSKKEHELEDPENHNYHKVAKIGLDLQRLRDERRIYKNKMQLNEPIARILNKYPSILTELQSAISDISKKEYEQVNPIYYERTTVLDIDEIQEARKEGAETLSCKEEEILFSTMFENKYKKDVSVTVSIPKCDDINKIVNIDFTYNTNSGLSQNYTKNTARTMANIINEQFHRKITATSNFPDDLYRKNGMAEYIFYITMHCTNSTRYNITGRIVGTVMNNTSYKYKKR